MPAPDVIHRLVRRIEEHLDSYRSGKYNETQLRREFLDPFFEALGWGVFSRGGIAEIFRDVVHEDSLEVERMLELHKRTPKTPQEQEIVKWEIEPSADRAIARLIYELYGLNAEEVNIIKGKE